MNKRQDHIQYYSTDTNTSSQDFISSPNTARTDKDFIVKDFLVVDDTNLSSFRGRKIRLTNANSSYTATLTDLLITVPSVSVSPVLALPKASIAGIGKIYMVKDTSGSALSTSISIFPTGTDLINGDTSISIASNYGFVSLFSDGNNWFVQ